MMDTKTANLFSTNGSKVHRPNGRGGTLCGAGERAGVIATRRDADCSRCLSKESAQGPALTETQAKALEAVREAGTLYSGNGVGAATIRVLARLGLVEVESSVQTWFNRRSGRNHSQCDWSATIKN